MAQTTQSVLQNISAQLNLGFHVTVMAGWSATSKHGKHSQSARLIMQSLEASSRPSKGMATCIVRSEIRKARIRRSSRGCCE